MLRGIFLIFRILPDRLLADAHVRLREPAVDFGRLHLPEIGDAWCVHQPGDDVGASEEPFGADALP